MTEISEWIAGRPFWLRYAISLVLKWEYDPDTHVGPLAELCKQEAEDDFDGGDLGIAPGNFQNHDQGILHLNKIYGISGINSLSPKVPLDFGNSNLSLVYGLNGSGKTGYVRILKHVSGARAKNTLLKNINTDNQVEQKASISYSMGGEEKDVEWSSIEGPIPDLTCIDIYDNDCARIYLTKENEITYEPPVLQFFDELIGICESVSEHLTLEENTHTSTLPTIAQQYSELQLARWYKNLSDRTEQSEVNRNCTWDAADEKSLAEKKARIADTAPQQTAINLQNKKDRIRDIINLYSSLVNCYSDERFTEYSTLKSNLESKILAEKSAREVAFADTPLDGVGADIWKQLWNYAKKYSEEVAYTREDFPNVGGEALCVLCQQPLSTTAKARLQSFEQFIQDAATSEVNAASQSINEFLESLVLIPEEAGLLLSVEAAGINDPDLREQILSVNNSLRQRYESFFTVNDLGSLTTLPDVNQAYQHLLNFRIGLSKSRLLAIKDSETRDFENLQNEIKTLELKKWIAEQKDLIEREIVRLWELSKLNVAKRLTNTTAISRKKGEVAQTVVTEAFSKAFLKELKLLGGGSLDVSLVRTRTTHGKVLHKFQLDRSPESGLGSILSEGEYRILSIAAFFADVANKPYKAPFVFDDPISSLDQNFEEKVAIRLIDLAKSHQVIIFTHRLSLLGLVSDYAKKVEIDTNILNIAKQPWGTGEPSTTPLFARKPEKAFNQLKNEMLVKARKVRNEDGTDTYYPLAKALCSDFRILLERYIEYYMLADVVQRHRRAINTLGKIGKLARIVSGDCELFDGLITKYSRFEHSQTDEAPVLLPEPDEFDQDFANLQEWLSNFKQR